MAARSVLAAFLVTGAVGWTATRAGGQARDPTFAEVQESNVAPGSRVTVRGGGWEPGSRVAFFLAEQQLGNALVRDNGFFESVVHLPEIDEGEYRLVVRGTADGEPHSFEVPITLQEGPVRGFVPLLIIGIVVLLALVLIWLFVSRGRARRIER